MVDMNTKVGKEEASEIVSKYGVELCNKRCEKRLHRCIVNDKVITNRSSQEQIRRLWTENSLVGTKKLD